MRRGGRVTVLIAGGFLVLSTAAGATPARSLNTQRLQLESQLETRLATINALQSSVAQAASLSTAHALVLSAYLSNERVNLTSLKTRVTRAASTTAVASASTAVNRDAGTMSALGQQVQLTIEADADLASATALAASEATLAISLSAHQSAPGYSQETIGLLHAKAQTSAAESGSTSVSTSVLAASPTNYPSNLTVFHNAVKRLGSIETNLAAATATTGGVQTFLDAHATTSH